MSVCATCEVEARPGSGVCHRCGRPLAETVEAAAAIKPVASPHPVAVNVGAPRQVAATLPGATTLPSMPALQDIQPGQHRAEPGRGAAPTADRQVPQREPIPPPRPGQRRRIGLILVALGLALALAWVASQVVPGLTRQESVAPAAVKPAAPGNSQAVKPGVAPASSGSSAALVSATSSAGLVAGAGQPEAAELVGQAGRAAATADWTTAIGLYEQARAQAPANEDTQNRLASAYQSRAQVRLADSEFEGAEADFTAAEKLGQPGAPSGRQQVELARHYAVAEAAWGQDDDMVLTELEAVYTLDPSYREVVDKLYAALLGLAGRQVGAGDLDGAVATLARAAELAPERAEAQAQLAALQASTEATGSDTGGQSSSRSGGSGGGWRALVEQFQR